MLFCLPKVALFHFKTVASVLVLVTGVTQRNHLCCMHCFQQHISLMYIGSECCMRGKPYFFCCTAPSS